MISDWWADSVKAIYNDALALLGGDDNPLDYGPGHLAWADGNFEDSHVLFCLADCESRRELWLSTFGAEKLEIVSRSLMRLAGVPEEVRDLPDPHCVD